MLRPRHVSACLLLLLFLPGICAIWPLTQSETLPEGFVNIGSLGLGNAVGKVVAFGDWNGNQKLDLFALSKDRKTLTLHMWNSTIRSYRDSQQLITDQPIVSVIPADFNLDGRLDLLVLTERALGTGKWWSAKGLALESALYVSRAEDGGFGPSSHAFSTITETQPLILDGNGDLQPDVLAYLQADDTIKVELAYWKGSASGGEFERTTIPFDQPSKICEIAHPHSNAFIDIDGDCLADVLLVCGAKGSKKKSFQVWTNKKSDGFHLAGEWDLPEGTGAISFADMDRDGTMDLIFPSCRSHSSTSGVGSECSIHIAYNTQKPLCTVHSAHWLGGLEHAVAKPVECRKPEDLCSADDEFGFDLSDESDSFTTIPLDSLFPRTSTLLLSEPTASASGEAGAYIPLRIGDFNLDGFPDLAILLLNSTAAPGPGGIFGGSGRSSGVQPRILKNVRCSKGGKGCEGDKVKMGRRRFEVVTGVEVAPLNEIWDARNLAWLDVDEDGSLDLMVQRSGHQAERQVTFFKNAIFHDAFFLKALVLNGACEGDCEDAVTGERYNPNGANMIGATYKFSILDRTGQRRATQVSQMFQTGYHALQTPYAFFGLGRINNYVEKLFIGSSAYPASNRNETSSIEDISHFTSIEGVIPNSQIIITPPQPQRSGISLVTNPSREWKTALYLHPGDWVPWVVGVMVLLITGLSAVAWGLHLSERREDEKERRKVLHRINFVAM